MTGKNANIYFPETTYNKLREMVGTRISCFVSKAVEEKLIKEEKRKLEDFRQMLIADYQSLAKNKKLLKEAEIWDETLGDA